MTGPARAPTAPPRADAMAVCRSRLIARTRLLALVAAAMVGHGTLAEAAEAAAPGAVSPPVWRLQRSLAALRDRALHEHEVLALAALLGREVTRAMRAEPDSSWTRPPMRAALVAFVLSGGDRTVAAARLTGAREHMDPRVHAALVAYVARAPDAGAKLRAALPALRGANRALAHLSVGALADGNTGRQHLRRAELLAPGTMIEEAALRRRLALPLDAVPSEGADGADDPEGEAASWRHGAESYLRRFGDTPFAPTMVPVLARGLATRAAHLDGEVAPRLVRAAPAPLRAPLRLEIAREATLGGHGTLARAVLEGRGGDESGTGRARAALYRAATAIGSSKGDPPPEPAPLAALDRRDRALRAARAALARAIDAAPDPLGDASRTMETDVPAPPEAPFADVEDAIRAARAARERAR